MWKRVWKGPSRQTGRHPGCVLRLSLPRRNVNMREVTVERPVRVGKSGLSLVGPSDCRDQSSVVRQLQSCFKPPKLPKKASISLSSFIGAQGHPEVWVNGRVSPGSVRGRRRAAGGSHAQEAEKLQPPRSRLCRRPQTAKIELAPPDWPVPSRFGSLSAEAAHLQHGSVRSGTTEAALPDGIARALCIRCVA